MQNLYSTFQITYKHINNSHRNQPFNQIRELQEIDSELNNLYNEIQFIFSNENLKELNKVIDKKQELYSLFKEKIDIQIARTE